MEIHVEGAGTASDKELESRSVNNYHKNKTA